MCSGWKSSTNWRRFSVFPKVLKENLCKWIIEFQRRLNEGHLRILDLLNMYGLLTTRVRSRWLDIGQVLFLRVYSRDEVEVHKFAKKKRTRPISSHFNRTNLVIKGFIIWLLMKFCLRDTAASLERARWLHLARSGSQSQRAIWFILPARGASHIISWNYWKNWCERSL